MKLVSEDGMHFIATRVDSGEPDYDDIIENGYVVSFKGTDGSLDRDNDTITPSGVDFEHYMKNPIVLFGHDHALPVAYTKELKRESDGVIFTFMFPPQRVSETANEVARKIAFGILNAVSIGFIPKEYDRNDKGGREYMSTEITEISVVSVPSNRNAVRTEMDERERFLESKRIKDFFVKECEISEELTLKKEFEIVEEKIDDMTKALLSLADMVVAMREDQLEVRAKSTAEEEPTAEAVEVAEPEVAAEPEEAKETESNPETGEDETQLKALVSELLALRGKISELKKNV